MWKGSNGGEVISFSGCDDDQTSADTTLSKITSTSTKITSTSTGAMTYCFIQAIEHGQANTYGSMLTSMRSALRSTGSDSGGGLGGGVVTSLLTILVAGGSASGRLRQGPQPTAYEPFDVYTKPFTLCCSRFKLRDDIHLPPALFYGGVYPAHCIFASLLPSVDLISMHSFVNFEPPFVCRPAPIHQRL
ncbi:hypothetical protein RND81_01G048100 [Saponaria officinalis]|uniref:Peptidase C14 caspase domain-containing protein n=1 Tax=Saponaria officinalis TaxID=3572 RepID=A0AAW1NBN6_SAPOF